jgi:hypothetical protein
MLGTLAMSVIVPDHPHLTARRLPRRDQGHPIGRRYSGRGRFRRAPSGNNKRRKGDNPMMLLALLAPVALLGVLLGMDRLERWTTDATEVPEPVPATTD